MSRLAWKRLMRNRLAVGSMLIVLIAVIIAILGYLITPDQTPFANAQYLELNTKKPGFKVQMLIVAKNTKPDNRGFISKMVWGEKSNFTSVPFLHYHFEGSQIIINEYEDPVPEIPRTRNFDVADVLFALNLSTPPKQENNKISFLDIGDTFHEYQISALQKEIINNNIKTRRFLLGTDRFGRDLLSQLMIGTRVSLSVGFISVIISLVIGITLGSIAGFFGGKTDDLIIWFINVVWSIPTLLLVIAITFALGKGFWQVFVAVGLTMWVEVARVVRGQILGLREKEYVEAGKALGFSNF